MMANKYVHCTGHVDALPESRINQRHTVVSDDIELTCKALRACGYRVHLKEKNGAQWVMAAKGIQVRYAHWHPLTNITQAMQLLIDAPGWMQVTLDHHNAKAFVVGETSVQVGDFIPQNLINAQCRAIVTACASLEVVR